MKPNTSYKLVFDLKKDGSAASQPVVNLVSNMSSIFNAGRITNPQDWKTYMLLLPIFGQQNFILKFKKKPQGQNLI
ncbi:hypothetical protein [Bacillus thuringiensis]|uniref:hypothetical protein n=1 Tax=Bacillus thuringiensis TaxID=1428 RepID=UPI00028A6108|nr:hypothetical protein [Bacillus thuringiensis]AFU17398.1 hypothetical protein MC28_E139 [Bacillus thuringiensis MC28]MEB4815448.1 hypothetical protein [Bacillus thuringiensis]